MKKTAIILLSILVAGMFVACNQDVTVDAQVHANIELGTFVLDGKNYTTLQEAVNAKLGKGLSKALGDNDGVIYLTKNASGPGAVIDKLVEGGVIIDFAGYTYSFTNVTGLQGGDNPKAETFGLGITSGADVTLKGLQQIDLNDTATTDLTMVYVAGANTKLTIEDAPKMKVEPDQYVFWAADGATLTIGDTDVTKEATITGKIAATGSSTEASKPTITIQSKAKIEGSIEAASATVALTKDSTVTGTVKATDSSVELSGNSSVTGSVTATESAVSLGGESKVTGSIEAVASEVVVIESSKIDANLTASQESTVTISSTDNIIQTLDKTSDSTVIVTEKVVVEEVAKEDTTVIVAGEGEVVDNSGEKQTDVDTDTRSAKYVALVDETLYEDIETAVSVASSTGKTLYICNEISSVVIASDQTVDLNLGKYIVNSIENNGKLTVDGTGIVNTITNNAGKENLIFAGGTYHVDPSEKGIVVSWCELSYHDVVPPYWTIVPRTDGVAAIGNHIFRTIQDAFDAAESGDTVKLLKNTDEKGLAPVSSKTLTFDLNGFTWTVAEANSESNSRVIKVTGKNDFELTDNSESKQGKIVAGSDLYGALRFESTGKLTIKNVTLENSKAYGLNIKLLDGTFEIDNTTINSTTGGCIEVGGKSSGVISNSIFVQTGKDTSHPFISTAISVCDGASVTVEGGSYSSEKCQALYVFSSGGSIVVKDGTFSGSINLDTIDGGDDPSVANSVIRIEGGIFLKVKYTISDLSSTFDAKLIITGGTFSANPTNYVADDYIVEYNSSDKTWTVRPAKESDYVASITHGDIVTKYISLQKAIDNAQEGDTVSVINDVTESVSIKKSELIVDLNGYTLTASTSTYAIMLSECENVTIKNGSVKSSGYVFRIGDHANTTVKYKTDHSSMKGYHPLAPAKNVILENITASASGTKSMFYFTNIEDDLTRANSSNPTDNDLYGKYIYNGGYSSEDLYTPVKQYSVVFKECSDKDSVKIVGGSYTASAMFGHMCKYTRMGVYDGELYSEVVNPVSGVFSNDEIGKFLKDEKYLIGENPNSYVVSDTRPADYTGSINERIYYCYSGGANDAIKNSDFGETVYIRENADQKKTFLKDDVLFVVYEADNIKYTGAEGDGGYELVETAEGNIHKFETVFEPVVAVYKTTNNNSQPELNDNNCIGKFANVAEGFVAATENGQYSMVMLLRDYTGGDDAVYFYTDTPRNAGAHSGSSVRFDLNGHVWTYTGTYSALVITTTSGSSSKDTVILDTSAGKTGGIYAPNGSCIYKENSSSENSRIKSGTFISKKQPVYLNKLSANNKAGKFYIEGGYFESTNTNCVYLGWTHSSGELIISGGSFKSMDSNTKDIGGMTTIKCTISGGTFHTDPSNKSSNVTITKGITDNGDGTWTVK